MSRKKTIASLLLTIGLMCAALCIPTQAATGDVLLDHDFEDGKTPFGTVTGTVEVVEEKGNKIAKIARNDEHYSSVSFDIDPATDFDLSMKVRLDKCDDEQWNWVKLCFRSSDYTENNAYHMHLYASRVEFAAKGGTNSRDEMKAVATNESVPIKIKNWYTVEIFARGDKMTAYVNGKKLLEMTDTDFTDGGFALASWGWDYSVDNIKITERSATDAVTPTFKVAATTSSAAASTPAQTTSKAESAAQQTATSSSAAAQTTSQMESASQQTSTPGNTSSENGTAGNDANVSTADNSGSSSGGVAKILGIVAIVVVVAIGAVTVVYIVKNMPNACKKEAEAANEEETADNQKS